MKETLRVIKDKEKADCISGACNHTMAMALPLTAETIVRGRVSHSGSELWYQFTVPCDGLYSIHSDTTNDIDEFLDTIGTLYDCCGRQLAYSDDDGENINFRIIHELKAGEVYYLKVNGYRDNVGNFQLIVTSNVTIQNVFIESYDVSLNLGETWQLETIVSPTAASDTGLRWWSDDDRIATIDNTGQVTAVGVGTTTVHAASRNCRGTIGSCVVTVEQPWMAYRV